MRNGFILLLVLLVNAAYADEKKTKNKKLKFATSYHLNIHGSYAIKSADEHYKGQTTTGIQLLQKITPRAFVGVGYNRQFNNLLISNYNEYIAILKLTKKISNKYEVMGGIQFAYGTYKDTTSLYRLNRMGLTGELIRNHSNIATTGIYLSIEDTISSTPIIDTKKYRSKMNNAINIGVSIGHKI